MRTAVTATHEHMPASGLQAYTVNNAKYETTASERIQSLVVVLPVMYAHPVGIASPNPHRVITATPSAGAPSPCAPIRWDETSRDRMPS